MGLETTVPGGPGCGRRSCRWFPSSTGLYFIRFMSLNVQRVPNMLRAAYKPFWWKEAEGGGRNFQKRDVLTLWLLQPFWLSTINYPTLWPFWLSDLSNRSDFLTDYLTIQLYNYLTLWPCILLSDYLTFFGLSNSVTIATIWPFQPFWLSDFLLSNYLLSTLWLFQPFQLSDYQTIQLGDLCRLAMFWYPDFLTFYCLIFRHSTLWLLQLPTFQLSNLPDFQTIWLSNYPTLWPFQPFWPSIFPTSNCPTVWLSDYLTI